MHALAAQGGSVKKVTISKRKSTKAIITSPTVSLLQDCLPSYGLFEASQIACPVLPQYHPQQLMELLNSGKILFPLLRFYCFVFTFHFPKGKIRWVEAILAHLVRCVSGNRGTDSDDEDDSIPEHEASKHWARTRTLSISSPDTEVPNARAAVINAPVPKEVTLDYAEISAVPPLPLWLLLAADQRSSNMIDSTTSAADSLFHPSLETHVNFKY